MKKTKHYYLLFLLMIALCFIQGCKKTNIMPPENHPATAITTFEDSHLNLLADEDRAIYLKESHKEKEVVFTCKMHPQIREKKAGVCSVCGIKLTLENGK